MLEAPYEFWDESTCKIGRYTYYYYCFIEGILWTVFNSCYSVIESFHILFSSRYSLSNFEWFIKFVNNFILYLLSCLISYLYGYIGSTGYKHFCFKFFTKLCFFFLPVYVAESQFRFTTLQFVYNFSHLRCMFFSIGVPTVALHGFFSPQSVKI